MNPRQFRYKAKTARLDVKCKSWQKVKKVKTSKTYNTEDSPVVTDLSTSSAVSSLTRGERTGSRIFYCIWSYVSGQHATATDIGRAGVMATIREHG